MSVRSRSLADLSGLPPASLPDNDPAVGGSGALATLSRYGRTFRLAGSLLPRGLLNDAAELYAFCRHVDDLADEAADPASARIALDHLRRAVLGDQATHPAASGFLGLVARHRLDPALAARLIDTMIDDLGPVRIADSGTLLRYAYGAAGTVGLMMSRLLGVVDPRAASHALDLGVAMQLTNIARDVAEDAQRDRVYLPADWLPQDWRPGDWHTREATLQAAQLFPTVVRVLDLAELYYESGRQGLVYLPYRSRLAVGAAAAVYREIGQRIRRMGPGYLTSPRCVVSQARRLLVLGGSLPASLSSHRPQAHDARLHDALRGEYGIDTPETVTDRLGN